jgi:hypothetical protein
MVQVFCWKCLPHSWALRYTKGKKVNVCEECHLIMLGLQGDACAQHSNANNSTPDDQQGANDADSDSDGSQTQPASPAVDSSGDSDEMILITPAAGADRDCL